jgi:hypothetical protein
MNCIIKIALSCVSRQNTPPYLRTVALVNARAMISLVRRTAPFDKQFLSLFPLHATGAAKLDARTQQVPLLQIFCLPGRLKKDRTEFSVVDSGGIVVFVFDFLDDLLDNGFDDVLDVLDA